MAGLLPGLLPGLSSVPILGPLLDNDPTPTRQADDEDARPTPPTTTTREAGGAERTTATVVAPTAITRLTPLIPGAAEQTTATSSTLVPTQTQPVLSIPTTASVVPGTSISAPESSVTPQESSGGQSSSMVPAIGITAGVGALFLIIGVVLWTRYRRGKWPFSSRRRFAMLDEPELEKNMDSKWDPSPGGMSRISRFVSGAR